MNNNTSKKKGNTAKKLIPAAGMLAVSASMLATSTYAWFTMSREVEVKNIQMTATVPEDIQLSLGTIGSHAENISLAKNTGYLTGDEPSDDYDWSNIADISHYYSFGKLIPASSTNGLNIYYTADASGVGRTMKTNAKFYQAAAGKTQYQPGGTTVWASGTATSTAATAHLKTAAEESEAWTPTGATAWNVTNDDGYYIDIPVWLRTSSSNAQTVYVYGYACDKTEETQADSDDLYKAVRVAILSTSLSEDETPVESYAANKGCLTLADGGDVLGTQDDNARASMYPQYSDSTNILDSDNYNGTGDASTNLSGTPASGRNNTSGSGIYAVSGTGESNGGAWGTIAQNNAASGSDVATLAAGTGSTFGTPTKLIIRVWLEGEDGNCWNENAGQDWNISLKFTKDPLTAST